MPGSRKRSEWRWGGIEQAAFEEAKRVLGREAELAYPSFGERLQLRTGASGYQAGAAMPQNGRPLEDVVLLGAQHGWASLAAWRGLLGFLSWLFECPRVAFRFLRAHAWFFVFGMPAVGGAKCG